MEYRIIESPTWDTIDILCYRRGSGVSKATDYPNAISLIQDRTIKIVYVADVARKAVGVTAEDIQGNYPQNTILLATFGDTVPVEATPDEIRKKKKEGKEEW